MMSTTKQDHLSIEEEARDFDEEAHAMKEEAVVRAVYINQVAQTLEDLLLLLGPPLVIETDAIQEVPIQDDHLVIVEEEEAKAIAK